jgi:hypothetical protein
MTTGSPRGIEPAIAIAGARLRVRACAAAGTTNKD